MRILLLLLAAAAGLAAPVLTGDTSHPDTSLYELGEQVRLSFAVTGAAAPAALLVSIEDEHDRLLERHELPVVPDAAGAWRGELEAPYARLGFYRVRAKLSDGTTWGKLGSRPPGFLTYAVVPPASQRELYPAEETFFGMQGGFNAKLNVPPLLGVRWVLGGYRWDRDEPNRPGEFSSQPRERKPSQWQAGGQPWVTYPLPCIFNPPKWAAVPETHQYSTGTLTPAGEQAWADYCRAVGRAFAAEQPDMARRLYQITWEPVYPWGFKGSDEDLIKIHQIAFEALHAADPKAQVIGPTGAGINTGDVDWNARLLGKGLGRYLDGLAIHPYHPLPPEPNGLVDHVRALREVVRQTTGRELPLYGTEQGWSTGEDPTRELLQAQGLLRANLIMLGEGFRHNFAFYAADYYNEPGYGYFYNLNPKVPWGTDKVAPKPVAAGYAAQSLLLEGHRSAGPIEWLGETALGYAYERGDSVVLALWDYGDQPREVSLPVGVEQVQVVDWMGNARSVATAGGTLKLSLGPEPIYVRKVAASVWGSRAERPLRLTATRLTATPGGKAVVEATVVAPSGAPLRGSLAVDPDPRLGMAGSSRPVSLAAGRAETVSFTLDLPADGALGTYPIRLTLSAAEGPLAAGGVMLRVVPPLAIARVAPVRDQGQWALAVSLKEGQGSSQNGRLAVRLAGVPDSLAGADYRLEARGEQRLLLPLPDLAVTPERGYEAVVSIATALGYRFEQRFPVNFTVASPIAAVTVDGQLDDLRDLPEVRLRGRTFLVRSPKLYRGGDDLAARLRFGWDERALYLAAEVTDDLWRQDQTGFNTWKGDCLQIGLDLDPGKVAEETGNLLADRGARHRTVEIDLALTAGGPEAFRTITHDPDRLPVRLLRPDELPLAVRRREGGLDYEAAIPWAVLGTAAAPAELGLAVAINDLDQPGELDPKALGLFGGITPAKDPARFGLLVLERRP